MADDLPIQELERRPHPGTDSLALRQRAGSPCCGEKESAKKKGVKLGITSLFFPN